MPPAVGPLPRVGMEPRQRPEQRQTLSALAVQTIALLRRSQSEVDELVAAAVAANPALTAGSLRRCRWCARPLTAGRCPRCATGPTWRSEHIGDTAVQVGDHAAIVAAARLIVPAGVAPLVEVVVDALDDRGLLPEPPPLPAGATATDLARAVAAVVQVGPPGVAAPDAMTCLRRQARWHAARGGPTLLVELLDDHPEICAAADPAVAARGVGQDPVAVETAVRFLRRRLTPAPLPRTAAAERTGPPPDVILSVDGAGGIQVTVLGAADLGLAVDPGGCDTDPVALLWWAPRVRDAAALLDLVDRRASALRRIAVALAAAQHDFVLSGPSAHRPLTRAALAATLGLHPSTVSRAATHATVALPSGRTVPMAAFFGNAVATRAALRHLLDGPQPPGSDAAAAAVLSASGHPVARRTVAKYRATAAAT